VGQSSFQAEHLALFKERYRSLRIAETIKVGDFDCDFVEAWGKRVEEEWRSSDWRYIWGREKGNKGRN
jgi:hypothetical protein